MPPAGVTHHDPLLVLVVEDAPEHALVVRSALEADGYRVRTVGDGLEAVRVARELMPDIVVLDLGLPSLSGLDVCREIRTFSDAHLIMLTGRTDELDRVVGLTVGADDYVTKPFSVRELVARVAAAARRRRAIAAAAPVSNGGTPQSVPVLRSGDLTLDPLGREVTLAARRVTLTKTEFDLLEALLSRPAMVWTRALLAERLWGQDWFGPDSALESHVSHLRRKIDTPGRPSHITTVRGVGYRLNPDA